jgi:hypothetical protein
MLGLIPRQRVGALRAEAWIGISLDESHRAKPSREGWITNRWPLLFDRPMRRGDCLRFIEQIGFPKPQRSACFFCPYRGPKEWADIRDNAPDLWEQACDLDDRLRAKGTLKGMRGKQYLHRSLIPLREVKLDVGDERQTDLFGNECEGMCGV